jgi:hypothetical protein
MSWFPLHIRSLLSALLLLSAGCLHAQEACPYTRVQEEDIIGTYWQYLGTVHTASGKTIHQGGEAFPSYLHFHYDGSMEEISNGVLRTGNWLFQAGALLANYRDGERFCLDRPAKDQLSLHFVRPENRNRYHYLFRQVDAVSTPFRRPWYELPTILVERVPESVTPPAAARTPWWAFWRRWRKEPPPPYQPPLPIVVEVNGGGYYGGLNPVIRQYVRINSEGRVIREVQTQREGLMVTRTNITRHELEDFAAWIDAQGYFRLEREYPCEDETCRRRLRERPRPVPLQLMVLYGQRRHVITLPIFGPDHRQARYIDYPPLIDQIVETLYRMADRPPIK